MKIDRLDYIGKTINRWTIQDVITKDCERFAIAKCECGSIKQVLLRNIIKGLSKQCKKCSIKNNPRIRGKGKEGVAGKYNKEGTWNDCKCPRCGTEYKDKFLILDINKGKKQHRYCSLCRRINNGVHVRMASNVRT